MGDGARGAPAWVVAGDGLGALAILVPLAAARPRATLWPGRQAPTLLAVGLLDLAGNLAYALAVARGDLGTVTTLAALYPAVTVALGWAILAERLPRVQRGGMLCAVVGCLLLGAG